jgi:hypothetical protein
MHITSRGDNVLDTGWDAFESLILKIGHEDSMPIADDEECCTMIEGLARVLVRVEGVTVNASAIITALRIDTTLGTATRRVALVYIPAGETILGKLFTRRAGT